MTEKRENLIFHIEELLNKLKKFVYVEQQEVKDVEIPNPIEELKEKQENLVPLFDELLDRIKELFVETDRPTPEVENSEQPIDKNSENLDINEIAKNMDEILSLVRVSNRKDEINKELHEELQSYKSGLRREILSSILKDIIRWHSKVSDQYSFYNNKMQEENADIATLYPILLNEYKNLADGLEDLLYDYDIEADKPKEGESFNPRSQKKFGAIATESEEKDNKIAKCVSIGFRDMQTNHLILQPEVIVYQKKTELQTQKI